MDDSKQMDTQVMATLKTPQSNELASQLDEMPMKASEMVRLLARYQVLSEADDDAFDAWFDALDEQQHRVLKVFEIIRGQLEHAD